MNVCVNACVNACVNVCEIVCVGACTCTTATTQEPGCKNACLWLGLNGIAFVLTIILTVASATPTSPHGCCFTDSVQHMHHHGLYHRDLKLENIVLDSSFTLKITVCARLLAPLFQTAQTHVHAHRHTHRHTSCLTLPVSLCCLLLQDFGAAKWEHDCVTVQDGEGRSFRVTRTVIGTQAFHVR